jgi:sorbitol/mannitol transport system substrate-binding protein
MTTSTRRRLAAAGLAVSFSLAVSGCAGFGNLGTEPGVTTVTLASVNNPQMQDMAQLLPEFNKEHPDIKINMIFMEENDLRNAATKDVATQGGQYDIMTVGAYEVPIWGQNRWLTDLTDLAAEDPAYDVDDFFQPVRDGVSYDGRLYAVPFYGESSFLMYRKDLFEQAGITMPERPTWDQIAKYADQLKDPASDRAGICLRASRAGGRCSRR